MISVQRLYGGEPLWLWVVLALIWASLLLAGVTGVWWPLAVTYGGGVLVAWLVDLRRARLRKREQSV